MSNHAAVLQFLAVNYSGGKEFTTRDIARAMRRNAQDVSNAISYLRLNKNQIVLAGTTTGSDGHILRKYRLKQTHVAIDPSQAPTTFKQAAVGTADAPRDFAARLTQLVANRAPVKSLSDFSDEELLAEVTRRLGS